MNRDSRLDRLASFLLEPSRSSLPELPEPEPEGPSTQPQDVACVASSSVLCLGVAGCLIQGLEASCNAWKWQIQQNDPALLARPGLIKIMEQLNSAQASGFDLRLPRGRLASCVLQHCIAVVAAVARTSMRFKVGITTDPCHRFLNTAYGYRPQGVYKQMVIIAILKSMEAAAYVEATLIREFRDHAACANEAAGGEGSSLEALLGFVYVVRCEEPPSKRQRVF